MTTVVNIHTDPYDICIMRPSKWSNPFRIGPNGTRTEVLAKYREWLLEQKHLMKALPELKDKVLGCCCKPLPCHGDILAGLVNGLD